MLHVLQPCKLVESDPAGSKMLCRMPVVGLPGDLMEDLKKSPSGKIASIQGPGVASYVASDGDDRVDIYVGLRLDGVRLYENISAVNPSIKMQFALKPSISCQSQVLTVEPDKNHTIAVQVVVV